MELNGQPCEVEKDRLMVTTARLEAAVATKADGRDDDDDEQDDGGRNQQLHLGVLPPHFVAQVPALAPELVGLVLQVFGLVHDHLDALAPLEHLKMGRLCSGGRRRPSVGSGFCGWEKVRGAHALDVLHHDALDFIHLGLDTVDLGDLARVVHAVLHVVLEPRCERAVEGVGAGCLGLVRILALELSLHLCMMPQ